jgi:hypothetical protein
MIALRTLSMILILQPLLFSQPVRFGFKAGLEGTAPVHVSEQYRRARHPFIIGPAAEVSLPGGFAFEISALHRRVSYSQIDFVFFPVAEERQRETNADSWEVPLVARKYFSAGGFGRIHAGVGFAARRTSGKTRVIGYELVRNFPGPPGPPSYRRAAFFSGREESPAESEREWNQGLVGAVGQEFRVGLLRLQPELRYTRWSNHTFRGFRDVLISNRNSLDFLVGVTFGRD